MVAQSLYNICIYCTVIYVYIVWRLHTTESLGLKLKQVCVYSTIMFGADLWALNTAEQDKLDEFGWHAQRIALRRQYPNIITDEELATKTQMPLLSHIWSQQAVRYAGHIARIPHERLIRKMFFATYDEAKR